MSFLTVLILLVSVVFLAAVFMSFIGAVALETDKAKANRYLADLHDRDAAR